MEANSELRREKTEWKLTAKGARRVEAEAMRIDARLIHAKRENRTLTHKEAQTMLVEIGLTLGKHAEAEFEHYDVIWRDSALAPRAEPHP